MIDVQRLGMRFAGRTVLEQVHFQVPGQHICALLGPNGAGKTTLVRCLVGALQPSFGACHIAGLPPRQAQARFGYLPDLPPLEDELRVGEHLLLHARLRSIPLPYQQRILEALELVDLTDRYGHLVGSLSRGQRSRLALAECLLHRPEVLILDEPSAGLDPAQVVSLRQLLQRLRERCCILLATHNLPEVRACCDSLVVLASGRVRYQGSIDELASQADGDLEAAYIELAGSGA
jgi:ABC-2 type transport system ATP-binding protein